MSLKPLNKKRLADELISVLERYQNMLGQQEERYEAEISQPSDDHLIIKLQLAPKHCHQPKGGEPTPS